MNYTIFTDVPGATDFFIPNQDGRNRSLEECIQYVLDWGAMRKGKHQPVAWAPEGTRHYGGAKSASVLREESIKAGRLIGLIDGKYVARVPDGYAEAAAAVKSYPGAINKGTPVPEVTNPNAGMILRGKATLPSFPPKPTPFDRFKDFIVTGGFTPQPITNGREFGHFHLPDTRPTSHQIDPGFATAAERNQ